MVDNLVKMLENVKKNDDRKDMGKQLSSTANVKSRAVIGGEDGNSKNPKNPMVRSSKGSRGSEQD